MTILALDFGTKRVGLAISHGIVAAALDAIIFDRNNKEKFFNVLEQILRAQKVERIILGLPLRDDEETSQSQITRAIGKEISEELNIPVEFVDESFSSIEAKESNAKDIDSESARIILERYINETGNK